MYIDFSEIPSGDDFENFAMMFLENIGLNILVKPAIGGDGGRDIIAEEPNQFGQSGYRWLISCKHFAKNGRSVGIRDDEANINKLREHSCHGFMFVYSTGYTEDLRRSIERACSYASCDYCIFNSHEIAQRMLSAPHQYPLIQQYMPATHQRLVGAIKAGINCCEYQDDHEGFYLFYKVNPLTNQVEVITLGECCIGDYVEHYNENHLPYSYVFVSRTQPSIPPDRLPASLVPRVAVKRQMN